MRSCRRSIEEKERRSLIRFDLQFFADDNATEEPTAKKQDDTRNKGQVAKSQELSHAVSLLGMFLMLRIFVGSIGNSFQDMFRAVWSRLPDIVHNASIGEGISSQTFRGLFLFVMTRMLVIMAPFLIMGVILSLMINILQFGFKIVTEPLKPKLDKFNPVSGFKRIFSPSSLLELAKSIVKVALIAAVAYMTVSGNAAYLLSLTDMDLTSAIIFVGKIILDVGIRISALFLVVGFADLYYQKWKFHKDLMMTKQEVKDEYKNAEGDPEVKGKQKQRMREASMRRMMQDVPKADVVITNPTHIAVALKYDAEKASAPIVVAKGEDYLANKIKEAAREAGVEIVENKPLARMLYQTVEVGQEIPPELYQSVAEILAAVYRVNQGQAS